MRSSARLLRCTMQEAERRGGLAVSNHSKVNLRSHAGAKENGGRGGHARRLPEKMQRRPTPGVFTPEFR